MVEMTTSGCSDAETSQPTTGASARVGRLRPAGELMSEGWHPDPLRRYAQRYHDGSAWTSHVSNVGGVTETDPMGTAPSAPGMPSAPPVYGMPGNGDQGFVLGSRGLRLLARILDGLIIGLPLFLITDAIWSYTEDWVFDFEEGIVEATIPIEVTVLMLVATAAYEIILIGMRGRTIGKAICGLTVVREDGAEIPGYGPATIRWLITMLYSQTVVPVVGTILAIATIVMAFATPQRQTLHDKGARTLVVKSSSLARG